MANRIKVLLWLHRSKMNNQGKVPLILRLTYQNQKQDKATGFYVDPNQWNIEKQRLRGSKEPSSTINSWIDTKIARIATFAEEEGTSGNIHLPSIIEKLFAKAKHEPGLLEVIDDFVADLKQRVGNDYTHSTYEKYVFTQNKVLAFIQTNLKKKDILLRDLTTKFIIDFDHYLRTEEKNKNNTAVKYCLNLKRILNVAVLQGKLQNNPLNAHKTVYKDTPQVYLSESEVISIEALDLVKKQHILSRDLFIFQCYTGLAYTDMTSLTMQEIVTDEKGSKWIIKHRQKTGIVCTIPLLPKALNILEKYSSGEKLLPHYAIQKYNQYIGEVGTLANIQKNISSHVGRRTFGNLALSKGISLNVISKILGHANTLITQRIYAITTQNIISQEIGKWE